MTDVRCVLTDLYEDQCAHCRGIPDPKVPRSSIRFTARRHSKCHGCAEWISPGDQVVADSFVYCQICGDEL